MFDQILSVLILIFLTIYLSSRPKRDFYLVEIRRWDGGVMTRHSRNYTGYTKAYLKKSQIVIHSKSKGRVIFQHNSGTELEFKQIVFSSLEAAQKYLELLKPLVKDSATELHLWRTVARTRRGAYVAPPTLYSSREALLLEHYHLQALSK